MGDIIRQDIAADATPLPGKTGDELRGAKRFTLLIRTAKLVCPEGEYCCVVRDASTTGVKVRLFHKLPNVKHMLLEMPNGDLHEMSRAWEEDDHAGFRFAKPADISRIIESPSRFPKRPVRINLHAAAAVSNIQGKAGALLLNLSQQGAMIACDEHYAIDQRLKIKAPCLPEMATKIRWRRENAYGLAFDNLLQFGELARIVAEMQTAGHSKKIGNITGLTDVR